MFSEMFFIMKYNNVESVSVSEVNNYAPTPLLTQQQSTDKDLGLMLGRGRSGCPVAFATAIESLGIHSQMVILLLENDTTTN